MNADAEMGPQKIGDEAARARCGGDDVIHLHP